MIVKKENPDDRPHDQMDVPVHDWHKEELERRKANLVRNPASCLSWEEVKRRVRGRFHTSQDPDKWVRRLS